MPTQPRSKGKFSREKGKRGEREVVKLLEDAWGILGRWSFRAARVLTESREGSMDVECSDAFGRIPVAIQVKNCSAKPGYYMRKAYAEAREKNRGLTPIGFVKDPKYGWVAIVPPIIAAAGIAAYADWAGKEAR